MALTIGTRLGSYEIVSALGAGGMGEVYRARDSKLNRDVALKVLPASVASDPDRLARFRREAQVLASLNHPNIAAIYGFEDSGATHALVMELVHGPTLAELIAGSKDPAYIKLTDALSIARQIADALEAAHEQGIVHRDLKPANVKVRADGTVKVLDFGLAKALDPTQSGGPQTIDPMNSPTLTAHATQMGLILGTAAYMSPEQAKGKSVDRRADIWAFGVVLYEMVTGRRGFEAEDISETLAAVLTRDIDLAALPPGTPARVRALVRDCLVRDPKMRLRDIGDARIAIDKILSGESDEAVSSPAAVSRQTAWRRTLPWAIAALALLAAAVATWRQIGAPPPSARLVTRAKVNLPELTGFVTVSRDGTRLAYTVAAGPKGFFLALRQLDQFEGRPISGTDGALFPTFSPDGQWIVFNLPDRTPKIKKIPITGGTSLTLCDGSLDRGAAWGDDDTIVFSGAKGLMRVPAAGGTPQQLTTLDSGKGETLHVRPQFLPGGRQLLFTVVTPNAADPAQFAVLDLDKGGYRTVARGGDNGRYAASGHLTFVRSGTMFAAPFDLRSLQVTGAEAPVIENVSTTGPNGTGDYSFSDAGLLVYSESLSQQGTTLAWADRSGATQALPGQVPRQWGTGRLSPDGRRVANAIEDEKGGRDIWVVDLERGTPTRLTFGGENDYPIWMPDGLRVVYGSTKDGKSGVFSILADGSGRPEQLLGTDKSPMPTSFTPDGKTLVYAPTDGLSRIHVLPPATGGLAREPRPLHDASGREGGAQISPDGRWVAYESNESGSREIYVHPFPGPGGKLRISTDGGRSPRWAPTGRELLYWGNTPGNAGLMAVSIQFVPALQVGAPRELFRLSAGTTWDVTPGGDRFLVEVPRIGSVAGSTLVTVTDWFEELRRRAPAKK